MPAKRKPLYSLERRRGEWIARCVRQFSDEAQVLPDDEARWANTPRRIADLFWWHRDYGLQRRTPHPMGKDLDTLDAERRAYHRARYERVGMEPPGCYLPKPD